MSKIAFFCIPAHGHTNPTLPVVRELINRGHKIWYYSYDAMRDKIESTGARYISCDAYDIQKDLKPEDAERMGKDIAFSVNILVNTTLALNDAIMEELKVWKPDCIVADSMATWGKLIADKLQIPFMSSTTTFAFNKYSAQIMKQSIREVLRMLRDVHKANKSVKRLQDKGYQVKNVLSLIANDNAINTIVYTSPEFQPFADTFSSKYTFVGPSILEPEKKNVEVEQNLIYVSLGTVNNSNTTFFQSCVEALGNSNYQVIISVGNRIDIAKLGTIPQNVQIQRSVNQIEVLQRTKAFITHCGMNSVNEALYFRVPLILFPQTKEEEGVASRVYELGAGIYLEDCTSDAIRKSVEMIGNNADYKRNAEKIAESFYRCGGAKLAADKIMEIAKIKHQE